MRVEINETENCQTTKTMKPKFCSLKLSTIIFKNQQNWQSPSQVNEEKNKT